MKAAVKAADGRFEVLDVPEPALPADDWVKVRLRVSGICGTDLRHWEHPEATPAGTVVGHESAGEVIEVGSAVDGLRVGDRVVTETVLGDGTCPWCRVQQYNVCPHLYDVRSRSVSRGFAESLVGPADHFYPLPDVIDFDEAALVDTFAVCLHAQHRSALSINDRVVVVGAGPIGLGQLMLAQASGADVLITDVLDGPLGVAKELGADRVVNSATTDVQAAVDEWTGGLGADVVFECSGGDSMAETLRQATSFARRCGRVVIVGGFDDGVTSIPLEWQRIQKSEITLIPSASFAFHGIHSEEQMVIDLIAKGTLNARRLITHRFPLDDINRAFETAKDKQRTGAIFVALDIT